MFLNGQGRFVQYGELVLGAVLLLAPMRAANLTLHGAIYTDDAVQLTNHSSSI